MSKLTLIIRNFQLLLEVLREINSDIEQ